MANVAITSGGSSVIAPDLEIVEATATSNVGFLRDALVQRYNLSSLNKTRIRFQIKLKKMTKSSAPSWAHVLKSQVSQGVDSKSDLARIKESEVNLGSIKVFKALDTAASQLRQEIAGIQDWMNYDNGDWVCPIELAPLVWSQLLKVRDEVAPALRLQLKEQYEAGYQDFQTRVSEFLSLEAWGLTLEKQQEIAAQIVQVFPELDDLEEYLQVVIGRPVIMPSISQQLSDEQAECLEQITRFIEQYDSNMEQQLIQSAIAGGEQLAAALLEDLANWEPGRKPIQFRKRMDKHLQKVKVLLANSGEASRNSLSNMMACLECLEEITTNTNTADQSSLQQKMNEIRLKLLGEQSELKQLASDQVGLIKATVMNLKY